MQSLVGDTTWKSNTFGGRSGLLAWNNFTRPSEKSRKGYFLCKCCGLEIVHIASINNLCSLLATQNKSVTFWPKVDVLIQHFKNPQGNEFDVITSSEANTYRITGENKEASWWPGFNWIVLQCRNCRKHIGWEYFRTEKDVEEDKSFFALVVDNLVYENDYLPCKHCGQAVVYTQSVFNFPTASSKSQRTHALGNCTSVLVQLFDNPCGRFFEVATFRQAVAKRQSTATGDYTWWAGFKWIILNCVKCNEHIGWEYVPINNYEKPFVGLLLHSLLHTDVTLSRCSSVNEFPTFQAKSDSSESKGYFCCKKCGFKVFHKSKFICQRSSVAESAKTVCVGTTKNILIQRFKNPNDFEFDVVTVSQACVFRASGESMECTWWSGFSWVILTCPKCSIHIGWEYIQAEKDGIAERPFFGLVFDKLKYNNGRQHTPELCRYKMDRKPRGWCLIINNENFAANKYRQGSDKDAERLSHVFGKLSFKIRMEKDLDDVQMRSILYKFAGKDHSAFDCFVCCVLTHGGLDQLSGINGLSVTIKELTANFQASKCNSLVGKPKLFFLQACQGNDDMEGTEIEKDSSISIASKTDTNFKAKEMIPDGADFLLGYATSPGYVSYRNNKKGSYYIQTLCNLLEKYALTGQYDIERILTMVNYEVAKENISGTNKQMPAPVSTLRKLLYFR